MGGLRRFFLLLAKLRSISFALPLLLSSPAAAFSQAVYTSWQVLSEGADESVYSLAIPAGEAPSQGLELRFYAAGLGGNASADYIQVELFDRALLVGFYRIGFPDDGQETIRGWHSAFLILPQRASITDLRVTLHQEGGSPRLAPLVSWAKPWDPHLDVQFLPLSHTSSGAAWSGQEALPRGKAWIHADGLGISAPQKAQVDYVIWKSFDPPTSPENFSPTADIYMDTAYAGTVNVVGEGFTGSGGYNVAVQTGVGQGFSIEQALQGGRRQCLWHVVSHSPGGLAEDVLENTASGLVDIALDVLDLTTLGYLKFIYESLSLISTLFSIEEKVAEAKTVVFQGMPLGPPQRLHAWMRINGIVAALGFAHTVSSFYTDGVVEGDLGGNRGIEVGGILVHYRGQDSPELVDTDPKKGSTGAPTRPTLKLTFSREISIADPSKVVLLDPERGSTVPCDIDVSQNVLSLTPRELLAGQSLYRLELEEGAVRAMDSEATNLGSYSLEFVTGEPLMVSDAFFQGYGWPAYDKTGPPLRPVFYFCFNGWIEPGSNFNSIVLADPSGQIVARCGDGLDCEIVNDEPRHELVLTVALPLQPGTRYTWRIPQGALGVEWPNLAFEHTFVTASLKLMGSDPQPGESDVSIWSTIWLGFNDEIVAAENFASISLQADGEPVGAGIIVASDQLVVSPPIPMSYNTRYTLTLPQGALRGKWTEAPSEPITLSFTTAIPPVLVSTNPQDKASGIPRDLGEIVLTFSEPVKPELPDSPWTEDSRCLGIRVETDVSDVGELPCRSKIEGPHVILNCSNPWGTWPLPAGTKVTVNYNGRGLMDLKGNPTVSPYTFSFKTGKRTIPPQVVSTLPEDGEENVSSRPIICVRFSKPVQPGPKWKAISLQSEAGEAVPFTAQVSSSGELQITPQRDLKRLTRYTVSIPAKSVKDPFGTPSQRPYTFTFRTSGPI
jgi:hypothetical protein